MTPYQQEFMRRTRRQTGTQAGNAMIGAATGGNMGKVAGTPGASPTGNRSAASSSASQGGVLGIGQPKQNGLSLASSAAANDYRTAASAYSGARSRSQASQQPGSPGSAVGPLEAGDDRELAAMRSVIDKISTLPLSPSASSQQRGLAVANGATGRDYRNAAANFYKGQQNRLREANDLELGGVGPAVTAATIADFQEDARNRRIDQIKSPYGHNPLAGLGVDGSSRGGVFTSGAQVHGAMPEATNQSRRKVVQNLSSAELAARDPELAPEKMAARKRAMQERYGLAEDGSSPTPRTRAQLIASRTDLSDSRKAALMGNAYARRLQKGLPVPGSVQGVLGGAPVSGLDYYNPASPGNIANRDVPQSASTVSTQYPYRAEAQRMGLVAPPEPSDREREILGNTPDRVEQFTGAFPFFQALPSADGPADEQPSIDDMAGDSQRYTPTSTTPNSQASRFASMADRYGRGSAGDFRGGVARFGEDPDPKGVATVIATDPPTYVLNDGTETRTRPGGGSQEPVGPSVIPAGDGGAQGTAGQGLVPQRQGAAPQAQGNPYQQATASLLSQRGVATQGGSPASGYRQQALGYSQGPAEVAARLSDLDPREIRQQLALQDRLQRRQRIQNIYHPSIELQIGRAAAAGNPYAMETFRRLQENSRDNAARMQQSQAQLLAEQYRAQAMGDQYRANAANEAAQLAIQGRLADSTIARNKYEMENDERFTPQEERDRFVAQQELEQAKRLANATPEQKYEHYRLSALADGLSGPDAAAAAALKMRTEGTEYDPPEVDMLQPSGIEDGATQEEIAQDFFGRLHSGLQYDQPDGEDLTLESFDRAVTNANVPKASLRSYLNTLEENRPKWKDGYATYPNGEWYSSRESGRRIEKEIDILRNYLGLEPLAPLQPAPTQPLVGGAKTYGGPYAGF